MVHVFGARLLKCAMLRRLLGPAKPVADVLAILDRQSKADGKPAIYFLKPDQPIAPHLDELLGPVPKKN